MNALAIIAMVAGGCIILIVVGVTLTSRFSPDAHKPRPQPPLARISNIRTTCGLLVPVAEARPRHWTHDAGGQLLSIDWHGRPYLVAAGAVPRGFADHLSRPAAGGSPAPATHASITPLPRRLPESVR